MLLHIPEFFPPAEIFDTKRPQERKRLFFIFIFYFLPKETDPDEKKHRTHSQHTGQN